MSDRKSEELPSFPAIRPLSEPPTWLRAPQQLAIMTLVPAFLIGLILQGWTGIFFATPGVCVLNHGICILLGQREPHIGSLIMNRLNFQNTITPKYRRRAPRGVAWRLNP